MYKLFISSILLWLISMIFMMLNLYFLMFNFNIVIEWNIYFLNSMNFNLLIYCDWMSLLFLFLVSIISSMIMLYSINYMNFKSYYMMNRFNYLMILFVISMYMLIISPNILTVIIGWDGLGLISYCLIIYYQSMKSYNSGMITIILNRLGDCSLLLMMSMSMMYGSWNLIFFKMNWIMMMMFTLMIFSKSAQIPFSTWLPEAMMAPTPVSSLVHSSTLVTAGIYMMIRYLNLLNMNYNNLILFISSFTMLIASISANFELDMKKIIAYSTLSQLSFMMSMLAMNNDKLAFFHLFIHAMFKSLMFMCVGSYIHYLNNNQHIKYYKGMFYIYPMKSLIFIFSLMSLMGFPFLVGFFSKDLAIENFIMFNMNLISMFNLMLSVIFSISYSIRIMLIMLNYNNFYIIMLYKKEDNLMNWCMMYMMMITLFLSKFYYNILFSMNIMTLNFYYKFLMLKMLLLGILMSIYFKNLMFKKQFMLYYKYFFNMNLIYKKIYLNSMILILNYEYYFEKSSLELISSKFIKLWKNFIYYTFKIKFFQVLNFYINMILIMIIFIWLMKYFF